MKYLSLIILFSTAPTCLMIMFIFYRYKKPQLVYESRSFAQSLENKINNKIKIISIVLLSICLSTINSLEMVYFNFGSTYFQYIPIKLSAPTAAGIVSAMSAAYTAGQAINFFIALVFKSEHMIEYHFLLSFLSYILLIFAGNSQTFLWIVSTCIGFSVSLLFPAILAFFGKTIEITDRIATIVWISCGTINFIPPIIIGYFIQDFPNIFILIQLCFLSICLLSFITFLYIKKKSINLI